MYPTPAVGTFAAVTPTPTLAAGRYTVIDTGVQLRQSYVYRLTVDNNGVKTFAEQPLYTAPFAEYITVTNFGGNGGGWFIVAKTTGTDPEDTAYSNTLTLSDGYDQDLTVRIYRAEVPANVSITSSTNGTYTNVIEKAAFAEITPAAGYSIKDNGDEYIDSGLTVGTYYAYRIEYYAGDKQLIIKQDTSGSAGLETGAGLAQSPSVPNIALSSTIGAVTSGTATRYYYTVTNSGTGVGATVIVQKRTTNTSTGTQSDWEYYAAGSNVTYHPTSSTGNVMFGTADTGISGGNHYFYVPAPSASMPVAPANTSYTYRVAVINNSNPNNYTVLVTSFTW
jgi:hypothetical protein